MKKINESAYSVLMTFTRFVREQRATKKEVNPEVPGILRSHPFTWDEEGNTMLGLSILLDKIEQHFNR
jgi:hypothetical protein